LKERSEQKVHVALAMGVAAVLALLTTCWQLLGW